MASHIVLKPSKCSSDILDSVVISVFVFQIDTQQVALVHFGVKIKILDGSPVKFLLVFTQKMFSH